jgi:hypothetical protein
MEVDVRGIESWRLKLSNPEAVRAPMRRFLQRSANVARPAVMANVPVGATGRARRSVRIKMQAGRFQVRVLSRLFYMRFLEYGTYRNRMRSLVRRPTGGRLRKRSSQMGIIPRLMFARAAESIRGQVQQFAREMVREIVGKVTTGA